MKIDDEVRLSILSALLRSGSVTPNLKQLQKYTGYHKATIKSSLDFLSSNGLLTGYGPKVDFRRFGYKLEVLSMFQADLTDKKMFGKFLDEVKKDSNIYSLSGLVGSGDYNIVARHLYKDVESFHFGVNEKYFENISGIHDFIKRKGLFYVTEPFYKMSSRTTSMIEIIRKQRGYDL